ncbi:MAG: hypothetical protein JNJ71_10410 [Rubrivivax sp.]|nr:hypothetical protein [Rubrivivax sp.]
MPLTADMSRSIDQIRDRSAGPGGLASNFSRAPSLAQASFGVTGSCVRDMPVAQACEAGAVAGRRCTPALETRYTHPCLPMERDLETLATRVFKDGNRQAVCKPAEFMLDTDRVSISRLSC